MFTGIRPGEKLHETLFYPDEALESTAHGKIHMVQTGTAARHRAPSPRHCGNSRSWFSRDTRGSCAPSWMELMAASRSPAEKRPVRRDDVARDRQPSDGTAKGQVRRNVEPERRVPAASSVTSAVVATGPTVPLIDPVAELAEMQDEVNAAVRRVLENKQLMGGPGVAEFEHEFAAFLGSGQVVATSSGPAALELALIGLGIGRGDGVIVPGNVSPADADAIIRCGARPLPVDIRLFTGTLDIAALYTFLANACVRDDDGRIVHPASKTPVKVIMPVFHGGLVADMALLQRIARDLGLRLVENCAQAAGAKYRPLGGKGGATRARWGMWPSFPSNREPICRPRWMRGAVATRDPGLAKRVRQVRDAGHRVIARQASRWPLEWRMGAIQAAVLTCKLRHLEEWNAARCDVATLYRRELAGLPLAPPGMTPPYARHTFGQYTLHARQRNMLEEELHAHGIQAESRSHFPLHWRPDYRHLAPQPEELARTEWTAIHALSLPMFPTMTGEQVHAVAEVLRRALAGR